MTKNEYVQFAPEAGIDRAPTEAENGEGPFMTEEELNAIEPYEEEPGLCHVCNGSGEGRYEGSTCYACNGKGEV